MRLLTPDQARQLDQRTFADPAFSSDDFIEQAGQAVFEKLRELQLLNGPCLVLCGPGNNGKDARVAARHLQAANVPVVEWDPSQAVPSLDSMTVVIDGLFGVGLNRAIEGVTAQLIEKINEQRRVRLHGDRPLHVFAIDVPSGLNALTGLPTGPAALQADHTLTFQAAKPGFFQNQGPQLVGRLWRQKLPYSGQLFREIASTHFACGLQTAARLIPRRSNVSNKGRFGVANLLAGSDRYPGAGILSARSALRSGVGSLRFLHFHDLRPDWMQVPETLPVAWDEVPEASEPIFQDQKTAWIVGPGLEHDDRLIILLDRLQTTGHGRVVLDAGALDAVKKRGKALPADWILTPHPKELSRLLGCSVEEVQNDRTAAAKRAQELWGATILLKGYKTVVQSSGKNFVILRGNSVLAKAGSGDVLSGIIGSLRAQGLPADEAAVLGAYTHAFTADRWLENGDAASCNPTDIIEGLPAAQKTIKGASSKILRRAML